jgi:hypothetical protein
MPAEQCETRARTWLIPAVPRAPFDAPPTVVLALHVPSDKPYMHNALLVHVCTFPRLGPMYLDQPRQLRLIDA